MKLARIVLPCAALLTVTTACRDDNGFVRVDATMRVEPASLDFGEVLVGSSKTLALEIHNEGEDVLRVCMDGTIAADCEQSTVMPEKGFVPMFEGVTEGGWLVNKGSSRQLLVTFTPSVEGAVESTFPIAHNGTNGPTMLVQLKAASIGPRVDLSAERLDFGEVSVGQRETRELTLINQTSFDTPVRMTLGDQSSVNFGIRGATGDLSFDEPYIGTIPADGTLAVQIWYSPTEEGPQANALALSYCSGCGASVDLVGVGIKPSFALEPPLLDLGTMADGASASGTFSVRNTGQSTLTVHSIERADGTSSEFTPVVAGDLPRLLAPGETLPCAVSYVAVTPGLDEGGIKVVTNAWDNPDTSANEGIGTVSLRAESIGPDIEPFPERVTFDAAGIGSSDTKGLVLANSGNAPLTITDIRTNGGGELTVQGIPNLPLTLTPGDSRLLTVIYAPVDAGMDSAELVVTSNDRDESPLTIPLRGTGTVPNACSVAATPNNVSFGIVEPGRSATIGVRVRAVGSLPCRVSNFAVSGSSEVTMGDAPSATTLQPNEELRITLTYAPTANGSHPATLAFTSDDPSQATVTVPIVAYAQPTDIVATPSSMDFGVVPTNCRSPVRYLTIYNTGGTSEQVTRVYLDPSSSAAFTLNPVPTPLPLMAGTQALVTLRYAPTNVGSDLGLLFIEHTGASIPIAVPLEGESQNVAVVTDTFQQNPTPADVLFIVDNSCSMMEEQANLGANLSAFLSFAQGQGVDYQIAVTTTDVDNNGEQGRFIGTPRILTPATPNVNQTFMNTVNVGISGATQEKGLEAAYLALSAPNIGGFNAGFLRPHASLAVIFVSDEEDQSQRALGFYQSFLAAVKPNGNYTVSAIAGTTNPECSSANGIGDYAPRYITTAQSAGGVVESICSSNWGQSLTNIGLASFGLSSNFELSSTPVQSTIAVTVNGAASTAWTYDVGTNSITFATGSVPSAYANIAITYTVQCL